MNEFTLYTFSGDALFNIVPDESSTHEWSLMSENRLSLTFELEQCVNLSPGCYVDFDGVRYYLLEEYKPQMVNTTAWKYNVDLRDAASWMSVTLALNLLDGKNTPIFNYTAPALEHAQIIVDNLNRSMGTTAWKVGSVISTANITIEYRGKYCSEVLQEIVDDQNTEWWLDGMTLNIGRAEFGDAVELGYGNGLLGDIVCEQADNMRTYAYLCPIGSTRNIDPTKYGFERLQLPNGQTLVPMNPEQGIGELAEEKAFSKIFPRYEGTVKSVRSRPAKGDDGREFTIYYIGDTLPFNPNDYEIAGLVKQISFLSGQLMWQDFKVNYDEEAQEFEIITRWPNGGEAQLPGGLLTPEVGDKYVVWNITMPDVYYTLASQEFLEAAEAFAAEAIQDVSIYKAPLDYIEVRERGLRLRPGQRVRLLSDAYFASGYYDSRITRITRKVLFPDAPNIDVSAVRATGTISRLQAAVQKSETQIAQLSGALPTVVKSGEDTSASDSSVYTSAKSEREFLNKRKGGSVVGRVDFTAVPGFPSGADFNGAIVRFDVATKSWIFPYNVCIEGGVAWNASIEGFKPQTVAQAVLVDWETIGKRDDGTLFVIGGTSGGGGGVAENVQWDNVLGKPSWITTEKPVLSTFTNDVGYITGITSAMITKALGFTPLSTTGTVANASALQGQGFVDANGRNGIPVSSSTGYMDIGRAIDFHLYENGADYSVRLYVNSDNKAKVALPSESGTLALVEKVVTLDGDQDVAGVKNFKNGLKVNGTLLNYNVEHNAFILPANLIVEGGIAWNTKLDGYNQQTVTAAVMVDDKTIGKDAITGALYVKGGVGLDEEELSAYLAREKYAKKSDIPSLSGYATESYVTSRGYITSAALAPYALASAIPTNNNQLTNGAGYITGINSSMVISALGYTPLSTNGGTINGTLAVATSVTSPTFVGALSGTATNATQLNGLAADYYVRTTDYENRDFTSFNYPALKNAIYEYRAGDGVTYAGDPVGKGYGVFVNIRDYMGYDGFQLLSTYATGSSKTDYRLLYRGKPRSTAIGQENGWSEIPLMDMSGNLTVKGKIAWNSSRVLKNIVGNAPTYMSLDALAKIKPYRYTWKDGRDSLVHAGGIADEVLEVLPEVITTNENGIHSMDYGQAAFTMAASLTPYVSDHEKRIKELERENENLKKEVERLKIA